MAAIIFASGFITAERRKQHKNRAFYFSRAWREKRVHILTRDRSQCRYCLQKGKAVSAIIIDHFLPLRLFPELCLEDSNLFTCCQSCHWSKSQAEIKYPGVGDFARHLQSFGFTNPLV